MPLIAKPSIPVATASNAVDCINAIRQYLITVANQDAGRADLQGNPTTQNPMPAPSQFKVTKVVYNSVTFKSADGTQSVTIPILQRLELTNLVTGETWQFAAPTQSISGGTLGASL